MKSQLLSKKGREKKGKKKNKRKWEGMRKKRVSKERSRREPLDIKWDLSTLSETS